MPICKYCSRDAGFFAAAHGECQKRYQYATEKILAAVYAGITTGKDCRAVRVEVDSFARVGRLDQEAADKLMAQAFNAALDVALKHGPLSPATEQCLTNAAQDLAFNTHFLHEFGVVNKIRLSRAMRELEQGRMPLCPPLPANSPFLFQKSEQVLWYFETASYWASQSHREYQSGSSGFTVGLGHGSRVRLGGTRGQWLSWDESEMVDMGVAALTTKHIYFASAAATFKVPYTKLISIMAEENGFGFQRDGARAKPELIKTYMEPLGFIIAKAQAEHCAVYA